MFVEYNNVFNPQNLLEIKDIGHCAIEGYNDEGLYFYMVIITVRGMSTVATCGPLIPDVQELPNGYQCDLNIMKYDVKKLNSVVSKWLNSRKPGKSAPITSAKIICIEEALAQFRDVGEYFYENIDLSNRITEGDSENG